MEECGKVVKLRTGRYELLRVNISLMKKARSSSHQFWLTSEIILWILAATVPVQAQIFTDGTTSTNLLQGEGCTFCDITGGTQAGSNLFHSFNQFSIPVGGIARFINNNSAIQTVISRVTGFLPSTINGRIAVGGTIPNFDLFLINPNGIIFGPNAQLNINGSFIASTASSMVFADGIQFSTTNSAVPPLLTINVPIGLQFGNSANPIQVQGLGLSPLLFVPPENTLTLIGGDVRLAGGFLVAPSGRIELGSVAANSFVSLNPTARGWALDYGNVRNFQDIQLSQQAIAVVEAGDMQVRGKNIILTEGSSLAVNPSNTQSGGTLDIIASESVQLIGTSSSPFNLPSGLFSQTTNARNAGTIRVTTQRFIVQDGALVFSSTAGSGRGGEITINASQSVELNGISARFFPSGLFAQSLNPATNGNGGNISITTPRLVVRDGAFISAGTASRGKGGNVTVNAAESVELRGTSADGIISGLASETTGFGDGGNVRIDTGELIVRNEAEVTVRSVGLGNAGNLAVTANSILLANQGKLLAETTLAGGGNIQLEGLKSLTMRDRSQVSTSTIDGQGGTVKVNASDFVILSDESRLASQANGNGFAGKLEITTGQLTIQGKSQVTVNSFGLGDAGDLDVTANNMLLNNQGQLTGKTVSGSGGNIQLRLNSLTMRDSSQISASTIDGRGGNVNVNAADFISFSSESDLSVEANGNGLAGGVKITTGELLLQDGSQVTVSSAGLGGTGNLEITTDSIILRDGGGIKATTAAGEGGNIHLQATNSIALRHNSEITAEAFGTANGGNITITAGDFILALLSENSDIVANASEGRGGNILAKAQAIFGFREFHSRRTTESDFTASSELGIDGTVEIDTRDNIRLNVLPSDFFRDNIAQGCQVNGTDGSENQFIVTGRGGLPSRSDVSLSIDRIRVGLVPLISTTESQLESPRSLGSTRNSHDSIPQTFVEAQGWIVKADGTIQLVNQAPVATPNTPWLPNATCQFPS